MQRDRDRSRVWSNQESPQTKESDREREREREREICTYLATVQSWFAVIKGTWAVQSDWADWSQSLEHNRGDSSSSFCSSSFFFLLLLCSSMWVSEWWVNWFSWPPSCNAMLWPAGRPFIRPMHFHSFLHSYFVLSLCFAFHHNNLSLYMTCGEDWTPN